MDPLTLFLRKLQPEGNRIFNLRMWFHVLSVVFIFCVSSYAQVNTTGNFGFEDGTFNGWEATVQNRDVRNGTNPLPEQPGPLQTGFLQHCIMRQGDVDPLISTISVTPPGKIFSARIGNTIQGGHIVTLSKTFLVDSSNVIFNYSYAVMLQDPGDDDGHQGFDAPHFRVTLFTKNAQGNNDTIRCANYKKSVVDQDKEGFVHYCVTRSGNAAIEPQDDGNARNIQNYGCPNLRVGSDGSSLNTAITSTLFRGNGNCPNGGTRPDFYFKDWTTVSVALNEQLGKMVTIIFTAADCRPDGHRGYAYISTEAKRLDVSKPGTICPGETKQIVAPDNFVSYSWTGPGITTNAARQTISINRAGTYEVTLTPESSNPDPACKVKIQYIARQVCPSADTLCETIKGSGQTTNVNLQSYNPLVANDGTVESWHLTKGGPAIADPTKMTVSNNSKFYANVNFTSIPVRRDTVELGFVIQPRPNASITTINPLCAGAPAFNVAATPAGGVFSGTGGVSSTGSFNPSTAGNFNVTYIVTDINGCRDTASKPISVEAPPTVAAGPDQVLCADRLPVQLAGSSTVATGVRWSGGSGTFSSATVASAIYTPGATERSATPVTLTITSTGNIVCPAVTDQMTVTISPPPTVNAGADQMLCENVAQVLLQGTATNASSTVWTGSTFRPNSGGLTPNFVPTSADRARGSVELTLTANAIAPCLNVSDKVLISLEKVPTVNAGPDQLLCVGEAIRLNGTSTNATGILWSGGGVFTPSKTSLAPAYKATDQENSGGLATIFIASTGHVKCEADLDTVLISLKVAPVGFLLPKYTYCEDDTVGVLLRPGQATNYLWAPGGEATPTILASTAVKYSVTMSSANNCSTKVFTEVENLCPPELYVADAFSPNKDVKNEVYHIYGRHIGKFQMYIFNRWGEVIYESNNRHESWDGTYMGKPMQMGVYPWIITWEGDSEKYRGPYKKEGSVSVVR